MAKQQQKKSLLSEYQQKQQLLDQLRDELQALESNQQLTNELDFKNKLEDLMSSHEKQPEDVIDLLDPNGEMTGRTESSSANSGQRAKRKLKTFINPHTGEKIETRGGNHKQLKEWQAEHGKEEVASWLQS